MAETVYTTTQTFENITGERVLSIDANGGTVTVEKQHGPGNWIPAEVFNADTVEVMEFGVSSVFRFTPTGGATYAIS